MPNPEHMREAIRLATEHMLAGDGGPFGAVIVKDDQIIARGWNQVTTTNDPTAHAEVVAIRRACEAVGHFELKGCELYTSCEPCPMCLAASYWARLDRVHFAATQHQAAAAGFSDAMIYEELARPLTERQHLPISPLLSEEGNAPFEAWLAKEDRVEY